MQVWYNIAGGEGVPGVGLVGAECYEGRDARTVVEAGREVLAVGEETGWVG